MFSPKYDISRGKFLGLDKTLGLVVVKGDNNEVFFNYGFDEEPSKVLYSCQKQRIPNNLSGIMFNRQKDQTEYIKLLSEYSDLFFFLPSIIESSEEFNKYLNNISITPCDFTQNYYKQLL